MAKRSKRKKVPPKPRPPAPALGGENRPAQSGPWHWTVLARALIIIAAVLWIYWPVFHGGWLWDDDRYITDNLLLRSLSGLWKMWLDPGVTLEYYPITNSLRWVQWQLWGMDTLGYHLTNVVLHIVSSLLVWRLLGKFHLKLAWLGGLLFAIHPVVVESVVWIAELKNTLSLPFFLWAMICWIDYEDRNRRRDYFLALGLFMMAMLCKTTMAAFPVVILLYAWWKRSRIEGRDLRVSAPFFGLSLIFGVVTVWVAQDPASAQGLTEPSGIGSRLAVSGLMAAFSFSKAFLPVGLLPIYPSWAVNPPSLVQFLPWLVLGGVLFHLWTKRKSWGRHALLGLGFFLVMMAPVLGFVAVNYAAMAWSLDHLEYLPMIGLIGLIVAGMGGILEQVSASFQLFGLGVIGIVMTALAMESHSYAILFADGETLWNYTLQQNPQAWPAYNNLGRIYLLSGRAEEAVKEFEQVLKMKPDYVQGGNNLGDALLKSGHASEALEQYNQALKIDPHAAGTHYNLGDAFMQTGRVPEAIEQFERALQINPDYTEAHNNLGIVLAQAGRSEEAMEQFKWVVKIEPDNADARNNLGVVLYQTGRYSEAIDQEELALKTRPDFADAHYNLGNALKQSGRWPEAAAQYAQTVKLLPDYPDAYNNLGLALMQTGKVLEAIDQFEQALKIKPDFADARNNLAKAQALQKSAPIKN